MRIGNPVIGTGLSGLKDGQDKINYELRMKIISYLFSLIPDS